MPDQQVRAHEAGKAHDHAGEANATMLGWALGLTATYLVAEVVGGLVFNSLALLSDAAHMLTDVSALVIALLAIRIGNRPADDRRTFGYRRLEILAAAFNAMLLFAVAIYVFVEGVQRFNRPQEVQSWGMLIVAAVGLAVNLVSMRLLTSGKDASFNVKGAYLEVWADMVGSVGVIGGALAIRVTGWTWIDPVVAIAIGIWVLPRTWILLRDTTNVLLEGVPVGTSVADIRQAIAAVPGVRGVHDLHIWSLNNSEVTATAHVVLSPDAAGETVRGAVTALFAERFGIRHTTVQMEAADARHGDADDAHA